MIREGVVKVLLVLILSVGCFLGFPKSAMAVRKGVQLLIFDPQLPGHGGVDLVSFMKWNDPASLSGQLAASLRADSGGTIDYYFAEKQVINGFGYKEDGYSFSETDYLACLANHSLCHQPQMINYLRTLGQFQSCEKSNRGAVDEVWLWGGPEFGYWEFWLAGPSTYWDNPPPAPGTVCQKLLPVMGFNYQKGVAEALESYGHRVESAITHAFGGKWAYGYGAPPSSPPASPSAWDKFSARGFDVGISPGCGNIHGGLNSRVFDPNNLYNYDWTNTNTVSSRCEDYLNYPNLSGKTQPINCSAWGCSDYGFKRYWYQHIPKVLGRTGGVLNNWWRYVVDYDEAVIQAGAKVPGDGNADGVVDRRDLEQVIGNWKSIFDYGTVLGNYGAAL